MSQINSFKVATSVLRHDLKRGLKTRDPVPGTLESQHLVSRSQDPDLRTKDPGRQKSGPGAGTQNPNT